jgi:hypothetical protein
MPQVSLNTPLDEMAISAIVELYNEFAEKPVKGSATSRLPSPACKSWGSILSSRARRSSVDRLPRHAAHGATPKRKGPGGLAPRRFGRPGAATAAVAAPTDAGAPPATPIAAGLLREPCAPRKRPRAPSPGKGKGGPQFKKTRRKLTPWQSSTKIGTAPPVQLGVCRPVSRN